MNVKENILIVSVFQANKSYQENVETHQRILSMLKMDNVPVIELQGQYNGVDERSILVKGFENRRLVERISKEFSQECYLESHNDRSTYLIFPNGEKKYIGTLTPVSETEAKSSGNYSYNPIVDQYYVTRQ